MLRSGPFLFFALVVGPSSALHAQDARQLAQQAVETELNASRNDPTHWIYFESDSEPKRTVKQWVAETQAANMQRVLERNGQALSQTQQQKEMDSFVNDTRAQAKQRKNSQHDDEQAAELLRLLPDAFVWTRQGEKGRNTILHFKPDSQFHPPDLKARVFAAMEGDMAVDMEQHRIVSLQGRMIRDVKFLGGLFGELKAGGSFDVERREIGQGDWQITETHVHIQGHALIFKNISMYQDDERSKFKMISANISLQQAESELLKIGK